MLHERLSSNAGLLYRDDPVILAWELANEPQTSDNYERNLGTTPGLLVHLPLTLLPVCSRLPHRLKQVGCNFPWQ